VEEWFGDILDMLWFAAVSATKYLTPDFMLVKHKNLSEIRRGPINVVPDKLLTGAEFLRN